MFAQEPPPDFDVPGRREPGESPELVAEVGRLEVACVGVQPKVVSDRMGHANICVTFQIYGHRSTGRDREAADRSAV